MLPNKVISFEQPGPDGVVLDEADHHEKPHLDLGLSYLQLNFFNFYHFKC